MDIVRNMEELARKWHAGQFRKGPGNVPYIAHPETVIKRLRDWGYSVQEDAVTLAVAWGHDLLEDTKCPEAEILAAGGPEVLAGIKTLSFKLPKYPRLTDEEWNKKKDEYIHNVASTAAPEILVVKMADRLCNTMDFANDGNDYCRKYLRYGECLFIRVAEMKFHTQIEHTLAEVKDACERVCSKTTMTFRFTIDFDKYMEGRKDAADIIDGSQEDKGMIKTVLGDITKFDGDAIVNAGNEAGLGGGGVDGAIHRAAGPMLYAECLKLPEVRPGVRCPTGEARITLAGDLPCKHVILTVGPIYRDGRHGESELLANCYRNSLALAVANGVKSIAFPSIATGVYGYPAEDAARVAIREVKAFLADHPDLEVTFVLFNGPRDRIDMKALYDRLLSS